jgi:hypothetical protein
MAVYSCLRFEVGLMEKSKGGIIMGGIGGLLGGVFHLLGGVLSSLTGLLGGLFGG